MTLAELEERKAQLDAQVEVEKTAGDVTLATALAWWDVATAIRDIIATKSRQIPDRAVI